jgi:hypothetical protein
MVDAITTVDCGQDRLNNMDSRMSIKTIQCGIFLLGGIIFTGVGLKPSDVSAVDLYSQNFDQLTLGPVVTFDTEVRSREAWTKTPPAGWTQDDSGVPTVGMPNIGAKEFEGWTFVDKNWWVATAGDQDRGLFANASGIIAVADPDEWDDLSFHGDSPSDLGTYNANLKTPAISLAGVATNTAKVFFHSSWRPEDKQKASLTAHYNNGVDVPIFTWDSRKNIDDGMGGMTPNQDFQPDAPNEGLTFDLKNPAGASSVQLDFRLFDASNDWWWAFDDLKVFTGSGPEADGALRAIIDRDTKEVKIVNKTGTTVVLRGYSLRSTDGTFDEANATFNLSSTNPNWLKATRLDDTANDLSEINLNSYDFPNLGEIDFGNVWRKYYQDSTDIHFEYLVEGSDVPVPGILEFTGNNDESYDFLDLNYNHAIDIGDWTAFKNGFSVSLVGQPRAVQHNLGDLDNDGLHTAVDFLRFKEFYEATNGAGSFALALAGVPEPSSVALVGFIAVFGCVVGCRRFERAPRISVFALALLAITLSAGATRALEKIFFEDFESLTLGPNQEETTEGSEVWTNVPPTGWTINNAGMPAQGNPVTDGIKEWIGWTFPNKDWWVEAAGDQDRGLFSKGQGTVMVADPDEWDDEPTNLPTPQTGREAIATASTPDDLYDTFITTKVIDIPAKFRVPGAKLRLAFDSSWRPEGMDDLDRSNNQTATIKVQFGNGATFGSKVQVLHWDSDSESNDFHDDAPNEHIAGIDLGYNGTSTQLKLEFGLGQAWNDWWWAVDNLSVEVPADPAVVKIDTNTGRGFLVGVGVIPSTLNSLDIQSTGSHLRGATATGLSGAPGMEKIDGNQDGTAGNAPGEQWEKLASTNNRIFEAFLFGESSFDGARAVDLGAIFDPATPVGQRDLTFSYTTGSGEQITSTVQYFTSPGVQGDYNNDGKVDAADYNVWRDHLGTNFQLKNEGITPGQVTSQDYAVWKSHFGETIGVSGGGAGALASVPEPAMSSLLMLAVALVGIEVRHRRLRPCLPLLFLLFALGATSGNVQAYTVDRDYRFGEGDPGAANNGLVTQTRDGTGTPGTGTLTHLAPHNAQGVNARYVTVNDRPDGVSGLGIRFNPFDVSQGQYLSTGFGEALNWPDRSPASEFNGGQVDYTFISDRGFQFWVKPTALPTAGGRADIVMDTNQHGVSIDSSGKFVMRYAYNDYVDTVSTTSVAANSWYHVSVVRPFRSGNGSILYVNGRAVAAAKGEYNLETKLLDEDGNAVPENELDTSPLVIGANTGIGPSTPDDPRPPTPAAGSQNFFRGIVDDLQMFVMGLNNSTDFGEYVFQNDDAYASHFKPANPVDLVDLNSNVINLADAQEFAHNWLYENTLKWTDVDGEKQSLTVGDLFSRGKGDFNFDGRVNLADWAMLNSASPGIGAAAMTLIQGGAIPEPSSCALALLAAVATYSPWRRRSAVLHRNWPASVRIGLSLRA